MKPGTFRTLATKQYTQLESLIDVLEGFAKQVKQHPSMLSVDVRLSANKTGIAELEAECLSDGSIVYNVFIS
jgi:hypothetical protein